MKKYQQRLKNEKEFEQNSEEILEKLKQIRAGVAVDDYPFRVINSDEAVKELI